MNIKGEKSHTIIRQALQLLLNLDHRGACGCEANTGDGAGIIIQPPHDFLKLVAKEARVSLPPAGDYGVGMVFMPTKRSERAECEKLFATIVAEEGQTLLGWRTVPTNNASLGATARASEPFMRQVFIGRNKKLADDLAFGDFTLFANGRERDSLFGKSGRRRFFYISATYKRSSIRACCFEQLGSYYPDLSHLRWKRPWHWSKPVQHRRSPVDRAHPTVTWPTTAKSTRCAAISWMHARQARSVEFVWGRYQRFFRLFAPTAAIPHVR